MLEILSQYSSALLHFFPGAWLGVGWCTCRSWHVMSGADVCVCCVATAAQQFMPLAPLGIFAGVGPTGGWCHWMQVV